MTARRFTVLAVVVPCLLVSLQASCVPDGDTIGEQQPKARVFREADAGKRVLLAADELLTIELAAQLATGYSWVVEEIDATVLVVAGREHTSGPALGGIDTETIHLKGVGPGRTRVTLVYRRPWEDPGQEDQAPSGHLTYSLEVETSGAYTGSYRPRPPAARNAVIAPLASDGAPSRLNLCDPGDGTFGRCTPIKDQRSCGSCWAFATAGVFENLLYFADPSRIPDLSEQYLVSCNGRGFSCSGGGIALDYYVAAYVSPPELSAGAVYEPDFPYTATDEPCGSQPHPHHEKLASWEFAASSYPPPVDEIKQAIQSHGPVLVFLCADSAFASYRSGVFAESGCPVANHVVVLVGWDDNGGSGYWYLRNSWGPSWGESGYMRISYGANLVGAAAAYAVYTPGNQPPVANAGPAQRVVSGATVTLDGTASRDPDGRITAWSWSQTTGPAVALTGGTNSTARFTAPSATADVTLTFALTVTDDLGATASATTSVTVGSVNRPPVAEAGADQRAPQGALVTLDGSGSSDPDGRIASYAWAQASGPAVQLLGPTTPQPSFVAPAVSADAVLTFRLTVTDDAGASASDVVTVTVTRLNLSPVAEAGPAQTVNEGTLVTLDGSASRDPDGSLVSYAWTQTGGPSALLAGTTRAVATITPPIVTRDTLLTFALTVTDDAGEASSDSTTVLLRHVNIPPVALTAPPQAATERTLVTLDGSRSLDPDGRIVSYAWLQTGGPPVTLAGSMTAWPTFTAPTLQSDTALTFQLTVRDDGGAPGTASTSVTIVGVDPAPIADAGPDQTVAERSTVTLDASRSADPRGAISAYRWEQIAGPTVDLEGATTAWAKFVAPTVTAETQLAFGLTVTGGTGRQSTATVRVTVTNVNALPIAIAGPDQRIGSGALVVLDGTGSYDADGAIVSYAWVQTAGPAVVLDGAGSSRPTFQAPSLETESVLAFSLTATDDSGGSRSDEVLVHVASSSGGGASQRGGGCASAGGDDAEMAVLLLGLHLAARRRSRRGRVTGRRAELRPRGEATWGHHIARAR